MKEKKEWQRGRTKEGRGELVRVSGRGIIKTHRGVTFFLLIAVLFITGWRRGTSSLHHRVLRALKKAPKQRDVDAASDQCYRH